MERKKNQEKYFSYVIKTELDDTLRKKEEKSEMTHKFQTWETGKVLMLTKMG